MRSLQNHLDDFNARGVNVVAVSVDTPEITRDHARKQGYQMLFLSDSNREVIEQYDLVHANGGPTGDIARPAEFLLDEKGTIRWVQFTDDFRVRLKAEEILAVLDELGRQPKAGK